MVHCWLAAGSHAEVLLCFCHDGKICPNGLLFEDLKQICGNVDRLSVFRS